MDNWINVKENPPEFDTQVLAKSKTGQRFVGFVHQRWNWYFQKMEEDWFITGTKDRRLLFLDEVTHWMPLP